MTWDPERYERWFATGQGAYALAREFRLLDAMLAGWQRRGHKLLDVGCGTGIFTERLWHLGFDVTGVDASPPMLHAAKRRFAKRVVELSVANAESLPYTDGEFDYCVVWSVLEFCDDPVAALAEAARVAAKGLVVGFLNSFSLYWLARGMPAPWAAGNTLRRARWFSPPGMRRLIRRATGRRPARVRSVLPGPPATWRERTAIGEDTGRARFCGRCCSWLNDPVWPGGVGAFAAMRVDLVERKPLTPLYSFSTPTPKPEATP